MVEVLVIDVLADVEIILADAIVMVLMSVLKVSYAVDVTSCAAFDFFVEAWVLDVLTGIGIALLLLADMNANAIAVVMTALEFPVPTPLDEFSS